MMRRPNNLPVNWAPFWLVDDMAAVDTEGVEPMANPFDATQPLRADEITEPDRREALQNGAPATERGLYLVPRVID